MTITRLCTLTAETQTVNDFSLLVAVSAPTISSVKARTGTYSYQLSSTASAFGRAIGSQSAVRISYWFNHVGITASNPTDAQLFVLADGTDLDESYMIRVIWLEDESEVRIVRASGANTFEVLDSIAAPASLLARDSWTHHSLTYLPHQTTGFLNYRINGVSILNLTGDTRLSRWNGSIQEFATTFSRFFVGGRAQTASANMWNTSAYLDDLYVDSYVGEVDASVPARRFLTRIANAAGVDADWTPLASTNVSQIDDGQPNGGANDEDATYNYAESANLRDSFEKSSVTIPAGYRIVGLNVFAHCKTLDTGPEIAVHLWDGAQYADSDDMTPPFDYTIEVSSRFDAMPDASPFTEADVNNLQIGYKSAGVYS